MSFMGITTHYDWSFNGTKKEVDSAITLAMEAIARSGLAPFISGKWEPGIASNDENDESFKLLEISIEAARAIDNFNAVEATGFVVGIMQGCEPVMVILARDSTGSMAWQGHWFTKTSHAANPYRARELVHQIIGIVVKSGIACRVKDE